jgi:hypothetical protein
MTFVKPPLDFTVVREDWSRYDLADNAILKIKISLNRISIENGKHDLNLNTVFLVLSNERGEPDTRNYSATELQSAIIQDDIRYRTVTQDWNEYVADDGTRIKIQPMVMRVAKTSKFNTKGEPIYWVDTQGTVQIRPPNPTRP